MAADTPAAFFSYCREDSEFALRLAEDLKAAGAVVWIDQLDIEPGQRWDRAVEDALNNCPRMLVVLSPASVGNDNVRDEISFALRKQKIVIPVLYLDCDIPLRLERHHQVDFRSNYERGLKSLLRALGVVGVEPPKQRPEATSAVAPSPEPVVSESPSRSKSSARSRKAVPDSPAATFVAFDLGTAASRVGVVRDGAPEILPGEEGSQTASAFYVGDDGETVIGVFAARQSGRNAITAVKRLMGRDYDEIVQERKAFGHIRLIERGDHVGLALRGKEYRPEEISAAILGKLNQLVEEHAGAEARNAVITVPSCFNDPQRQATRKAGTLAGFNETRLINDTTAVALAYGMRALREQTVAIFCMGAGAFSVSVVQVGDGVVEVRSINGDTRLGGNDIDQRIVDWLAEEFHRDQGLDLRNDELAWQRLRQAAERAKVELSSVAQTRISLPFLTADESGPKHLEKTLTRSKLEELAKEVVERTVELCHAALQDAGITADKIDALILAGGQTYMPRVRALAKEVFGNEPYAALEPRESVAMGAAIWSGVLSGTVKDLLVLDVTPLTLSIETMGGVATPMIPRNTTIPTRKTEVFSTASDNQTSVEIRVMQGEQPMAADNRRLGTFHLLDLAPKPRGVPQIEVSFDIDANGILNVSARDLDTGKEKKVLITS